MNLLKPMSLVYPSQNADMISYSKLSTLPLLPEFTRDLWEALGLRESSIDVVTEKRAETRTQ